MYNSPARSIDFDRSAHSTKLKNSWHERIKNQIDNYRDLPRFLDPLDIDNTAARDTVSWSGFPRALDAWLNIKNKPGNMTVAHAAAEVLDRYIYVLIEGRLRIASYAPLDGMYMAPMQNGVVSVENAFSFAERPQDEYLEWHVVRNAGKVTRIDFTSEAPEYWETLAEGDPDLAATVYSDLLSENVPKADLFYSGDVYCPEVRPTNGRLEIVRYVPLDSLLDGDNFRAGQYNRWNVWNTERGAIHLTQSANTLFAEINLAARATQRFAVRPDLATDVDRFTLTACGGYGGVNRNSDPSIGEAINTLALDGLSAMVSDPIGLYIGSVDLTSFRDPGDSPVNRDDILTVHRGEWNDSDGLARVLRFSIHPPAGADYSLDECSFDSFPLNTGGPVARKTSVIIHGIGMANNSNNPILNCESALCEHSGRSPKLFKAESPGASCPDLNSDKWRLALPIKVPDYPQEVVADAAVIATRNMGRRL